MKKVSTEIKKILKDPRSYKNAKKVYFAFIFFIVFFTFYHIGYSQKIIPGVKIGEVFVGGMSYTEAHVALTDYLDDLDPVLQLTHEGFTHILTGDEMGLVYDVEGSVSRAFELGRTGNPFIDVRDKLASLVKTITIKSHYDWDDSALSNEFTKIKGSVNKEAVEPAFSLDENTVLVISNPSIGKKASDKGLYDAVMARFDYINFGTLEIPVETRSPELKFSDLKDVENQVALAVAGPLRIRDGDKEWILDPKNLLNFLEVVPSELGSTELILDRQNFDAYVDFLRQEVDRLPRGIVTNVQDGVVVSFELLETGSELDTRKFTEDFRDALLSGTGEVFVTTIPIDTLGNTSKYGIFTLLGSGSSTYIGSAAARVHNLTLAAERTNGVLVPPGSVYSFNNSVGDISGATGYDTAYIISNGRTVLGEGGGVCQTSTTLFRAILNSGLPILTRFPHAYRVSYYEQDQPVGFDASIYQPSLDFQFKNDTPNYVLVQSSWDIYAQSLTFDIFGTPDGRETSITEPIVTNFVAPPEPLYQDDESLSKGVVKQIDFEAWGATSQFNRTVTKSGETLHKDNFSSTYQPWRAVYLVGTS